MAKYSRVTAKVFGETASTSNTPKEIGQFGSAKAGTYNATGDIATIQGLPAWSNGWIDAVTPTQQFPSLPEMTGVHKVLSQQIAYTLQQGIPEWDSATTYYINGFCSKGGKIYISQSDNNLNNDPESDTVNWQEFTSGSSRNIGEIVASTIPLTDAGLHLLDGALISGSGSYAGFVTYIADLYDSGDYTDIFETEANWQTSVTTYGVCGKFVYDSVNNTVRLPKITGFVEGAGGVTTLGDLVEAGLPNITGTLVGNIDGSTTYGFGAQENGAFKVINNGYKAYGVGNSTDRGSVSFDASRSSAIYGNSSMVQPQSVKVLYYIVIVNAAKTEIQVDIDEIATDLNGKADVDLTNVNAEGTSKCANWAMPSSTYDSLTLGASGSSYTAPSNGWFAIDKGAGSNNVYLSFENIDAGYARTINVSNSGNYIRDIFPAKKGDHCEIWYSATGTTVFFRFYYAAGSESEAQ